MPWGDLDHEFAPLQRDCSASKPGAIGDVEFVEQAMVPWFDPTRDVDPSNVLDPLRLDWGIPKPQRPGAKGAAWEVQNTSGKGASKWRSSNYKDMIRSVFSSSIGTASPHILTIRNGVAGWVPHSWTKNTFEKYLIYPLTKEDVSWGEGVNSQEWSLKDGETLGTSGAEAAVLGYYAIMLNRGLPLEHIAFNMRHRDRAIAFAVRRDHAHLTPDQVFNAAHLKTWGNNLPSETEVYDNQPFVQASGKDDTPLRPWFISLSHQRRSLQIPGSLTAHQEAARIKKGETGYLFHASPPGSNYGLGVELIAHGQTEVHRHALLVSTIVMLVGDSKRCASSTSVDPAELTYIDTNGSRRPVLPDASKQEANAFIADCVAAAGELGIGGNGLPSNGGTGPGPGPPGEGCTSLVEIVKFMRERAKKALLASMESGKHYRCTLIYHKREEIALKTLQSSLDTEEVAMRLTSSQFLSIAAYALKVCIKVRSLEPMDTTIAQPFQAVQPKTKKAKNDIDRAIATKCVAAVNEDGITDKHMTDIATFKHSLHTSGNSLKIPRTLWAMGGTEEMGESVCLAIDNWAEAMKKHGIISLGEQWETERLATVEEIEILAKKTIAATAAVRPLMSTCHEVA